MQLRKNKLGLQEFNSAEYKTEHRVDISSILEFSNRLAPTLVNSSSVVNQKKAQVLITDFLLQFDYLNEQAGSEELVQLLLETLRRTDDDNNVKKLPANNAMFLAFKFLDTVHAVINTLENDTKDINLFMSDKQRSIVSKRKTLISLKSLEHNLNLVVNRAFELYGMSVEAFLSRFNQHPLWQSILLQQAEITIRRK